MPITMYGIPNCDTIKKAKKWLTENKIDFTFHDYRKEGIDEQLVKTFCDLFGWETVLNKRGTTYRQLTQAQKDELDLASAIRLLVDYPAMIKRPIIVKDDASGTNASLIGFNAAHYQEFFK